MREVNEPVKTGKELTNSEKSLIAVLEQIKRSEEEPWTDVNSYGMEYEINQKLRRRTPNSYFLPDCYDEAICGVNPITESIIYNWTHLGSLYVCHTEGNHAYLRDRIECGHIMVKWVEELTSEELDGKVPPTVMVDDDDLKYW